jgi:catechol 2,3-dioxygenase-like lactoylglutathione lyase family enzyme
MIRGISELVLVVTDVARSTAFYRDVVGLTVERTPSDEWTWFILRPPPHPQRLALHKGSLLFEEHSPLPEGKRFGPVHFAFEVARDEVDSHLDRLRRASVPVHGPMRLEWMQATSWYFYDPDGNMLELWTPDVAH